MQTPEANREGGGAPLVTDTIEEFTTGEEEAGAEQAPPVLYDANARQRFRVLHEIDGDRYELGLIFGPISDTALANYARRCAAAAAEGEEDSGATLSEHARIWLDAAARLFDELTVGIDNIGEEGEETPDDWRDIFGATDKSQAIIGAVFAVEPVVVTPPKAGARAPWPSGKLNAKVRLLVPFDGAMIEVSHTLKRADARAFGQYTALMQKVFAGPRGSDAHMLKLAAGYDALHVAHEGYASHVPVHHKAFAYVEHMSRQMQFVRKN
ncbi:MAG TPA: hypothetical protein VF611_12285 [Pyrinomonadaceae bacterium]